MLKRNDSLMLDAPIVPDVRPSASLASWARMLADRLDSAPLFSSLQRRIIFFNLVGLALLIVGMTYLSSSKRNPIEMVAEALMGRGYEVAAAISEEAGAQGGAGLDTARVAGVLDPLLEASGVRARLFTLDASVPGSYGNPDDETGLAPRPVPVAEVAAQLRNVLDRTFIARGEKSVEGRYETAASRNGPDEEVWLAAMGGTARGVRVNPLGELVVSVAVPISTKAGNAGVLQLSAIGGDIEGFLLDEHRSMLEVFLLMAIVSILLSILLANMIVSPIRQLAQAAARSEGPEAARPVGPDKPRIPDMTNRTDEIGELSGALIRMTNALYARIDAIESFAADVAHEIKNPLTSLRSAVETMQYAKTPQQAQRLIEVIRNDVARMDRLVTDISNASRLDAELVRERMEPFDLGQLLTMLGGITETEGHARRIRVQTRLSERPLMARGLEGPIAQVITNLLNNALSFAPTDSTITVTATRTAGGVRIAVEDEGPGIAPENLDAIFERFYSERPHSEGFGNHSGLGLSISQQIVEGHGGRIKAENIVDPADAEVRRGARFIVDLPG